MKAIVYQTAHTISSGNQLKDIELPTPVPQPNDLLVEVKAVSVNPVDTKVRQRADAEKGAWKVLGWDAAGVVKAVGDQVVDFKVGDEVWYAGDITRQGSNAEMQLVDSRIAAHKPASLDFSAAAALPLTSLTAWELVFDRLRINDQSLGAVLIIGAAGGVGSILIQLLRAKTQLTVIATASRSETVDWVKGLGAHHVINHHQPLKDELANIGYKEVHYVISLTNTDQHITAIADVLQAQGQFALIDDPMGVDFTVFKRKSISIHWESMFTRTSFATDDMAHQGKILSEVAQLVEVNKLRSTMTQDFGAINAANIWQAHKLLESGASIGKIVLTGF